MNREAFLARVREAARAGRQYRVHLAEHLPEQPGYVGSGDDPCARLADEVNAVGGTAHPVADLSAARETLAQLLARYAPRSALCWRHPLLDQLGLSGLLAERAIEQIDRASLDRQEPAARRATALAAEIGISSVSWALAESGTLALFSGPGQERMVSLLPPVHVAIVARGQILPDLFDLFALLRQAGPDKLPSNLVLVTGPSKTGDIELTLTTGVHGPREWHVIIVREA